MRNSDLAISIIQITLVINPEVIFIFTIDSILSERARLW